jgi:class 3 adenylate cyclase
MPESDSASSLLDSLVSYVPTLITRRLAATPLLPDTPLAERQLAVVLFADISGFTVLTERLAQQGSAGAET